MISGGQVNYYMCVSGVEKGNSNWSVNEASNNIIVTTMNG